MDERSGAKCYDRSGKVNHGTIGDATWVAAKRGAALTFDGVNDYVNCGNNASLQLSSTGTIAALVKPIAGAPGSIICKGNLAANRNGYNFFIRTGQVFSIELCDATGYTILNCGTLFIYGRWVYVVVTFDGSLIKWYINGTFSNQGTQTRNALSTAYNLNIARSPYGGYYYGNVALGDVRIYNRALTASEVKRLYESELCLVRTGG